jgi:chemotaxis protein methyltransferase CheR
MKIALPDALLAQFSELVAARTALHFPQSRWRDLECKACAAAKEFEFADAETFIRWAVSSSLTREQMDILASHLTISETYFWREPGVFEALGDKILPELIRARGNGERRLRIWSAGCSTGEEPYSIAIALRRALPAPDDWNVTILATDINPKMLRKAAAGAYGEWSFRNAPPWLTEGYFRRTKDGKIEILPEIRKMVTFAYLNLAEDIYPSPLNNTNAMDLIFCRNVLMYFAPERVRQIGQSLHHSLVEGGWLMVGASELSQLLFPQFASVHFPGTIVYRKESGNPQPAATFHLDTALAQEPFVQDSLKPAAEVEWLAPPNALSTSDVVPCAERAAPQHTAHTPVRHSREAGNPAEADLSAPRTVIPAKVGIQESPVAPPAIALSVRTLANQGRLAEALASCDEAIAADKLDPGLHYLRATILQELNREGDAIASLKRALYLDPDFALAHFALGNLAIRQGEVRRARRCFENVLALLTARQEEDILPESEGLTAGRFREIIHATMQIGALA